MTAAATMATAVLGVSNSVAVALRRSGRRGNDGGGGQRCVAVVSGGGNAAAVVMCGDGDGRWALVLVLGGVDGTAAARQHQRLCCLR